MENTRKQALGFIFGVLAAATIHANAFAENATLSDIDAAEGETATETFNKQSVTVCDKDAETCKVDVLNDNTKDGVFELQNKEPCMKIYEAKGKDPYEKLNCTFVI